MHLLGEVVGLGLRRSLTCPVEINLMPPALVAKKVFRKRQPYFGLIALGVALIMLCWWVYLGHMQKIRKKQFEHVEKRTTELDMTLRSLQKAVDDEKHAREKVDKIAAVVGKKTQWIQIIEDIHSRMPEGMWLTSLSPIVRKVDGVNRITHIEIIGCGFSDKLVDRPEKSAVEDLRDKLRSSPFFTKDTEIKKQPLVEKWLKQFEIWVALKDPVDSAT